MNRALMVSLACAAAATLGVAAGCASRTAAATQSAGKLFDAKTSDEKAIAVADQVLAAVGGEAAWTKAKEFIWIQGVVVDGKLVDGFRHSWDRWNGRHQFARPDSRGKLGIVMHELFSDVGTATVDKNPVMKDDAAKMIKDATKRFDADAYLFFLPFKLKDPGVHLAFAEERPEEGTPRGSPMKYDVIKITFDQGVGPSSGDTYYLVVAKDTHLPDTIEMVPAGKDDDSRRGYKLEKWVEVKGLKFATIRTTLGYTKPDAPKVKLQVAENMEGLMNMPNIMVPSPGEQVLIGDVQVNAEPEDELYIPRVL